MIIECKTKNWGNKYLQNKLNKCSGINYNSNYIAKSCNVKYIIGRRIVLEYLNYINGADGETIIYKCKL